MGARLGGRRTGPIPTAPPTGDWSMMTVTMSRRGDSADLILQNGSFYPVLPPGKMEGSLAVRDGRILVLASQSQVDAWRGPGTMVIDLAGRTVTPGLIDAHSHLLGLGNALNRVDLAGSRSFDELVERVREAAHRRPVGAWIRGRGWDQNLWCQRSFPSHQRLTDAVPAHPVWLTRVDGHAVLLNGLAMQQLEIDPLSEDPPGGRYLRHADGSLTGVLIDGAISAVEERLPRSSSAERKRRLLLAARHCLAYGLTTVTEMGVGEETCRAYEELRDAGEMPLRVALFLGHDEDLLTHWFERGPRLDSKARLQIRGVKLFADGALGSRGAALLEPYSDEPGHRGLPQASSEEIAAVCGAALEGGFQAAVHAIGDLGGRLVLDGFERALGGPRPAARFRLEHAQVLELGEFSRMARLGIIASMQPSHATSDMGWAEQRLGAQRMAGAYAWRSVLQAGGRLALGSDFPIEPADPRRGLYAAVTRQDRHGRPLGGWRPEQRLTRHEVLRGFTLDAAYSLFLDSELGSLAPGKRADLVVFERDIMVVPANEILTVGVDLTLLEGKVVFRREAAS